MAKNRHLLWLLPVGLCLFLPLLLYFVWMPDISRLKKENPRRTAFMEYRQKKAAEKGRKFQVMQVWVPLNRVSPYLSKAVLIAEDDKFWSHEGFDYESIEKAIEKDLQAGRFKSGGSTLSQQLARNLYLSPEKSLVRKMAEAVITWKMERTLSKKRILEIYLNVVEWGEGIFGAEAAARHYFGKPALELAPEEAARLAAVLPNPRRYNPVGEQRYVVNRARTIYNIMQKRGIVSLEYSKD